MISIDHDAEKFDPDKMSLDYGVFFLNRKEAGGPPRKITPYMQACVYYLAEEVSPPWDDKIANLMVARIKSLLPWAGFFMLIFGIPLALDPDWVNTHWLGWLIFFLGLILCAGTIINLLVKSRKKKRGYDYVLTHGSLVYAAVKEHLVYDGIVRELKYHKPVVEDGALMFDRQWVMQSMIKISIEDNEIEFTTFRPEIISVFNKGEKIPVLWHPRWPKLFIPVENEGK